ncbi:MAG: serine hydroxymethyltransferase [Actinomycetota bacterium]|nr:serine hydroxymethyltransferase [Actinomycetota bacterium]
MTYWGPSWEELERTDPEIAKTIMDEIGRLRSTVNLIASENLTSPAVLAALGSPLTAKYAEGYPGRRYYGGCEFVDVAENLAIERAKKLFSAEHANVQPHAGAQANLAAYAAFMRPGDTFLGMSLAHGGHLTHGSPVNVSGKWFNVVSYQVHKDDELIDMDQVRDLAKEHRPKVIVAGATAYPRIIDFKPFREIADEVGAIFMVDAAHFIGLIAGGVYPNPFPHADVVTATTHKALRGPRGGMILSKAEHAKAIDKAVFPMMQGGPLMHVIAAKAVSFQEALQPEFKDYALRIVRSAKALGEALAGEGFRLVSGGTDSHLLLVDLGAEGVTGDEAEKRLEASGIVCNKNAIPFDPRPPSIGSGIRLGTPLVSTLGMDVEEMKEIGAIIGSVLHAAEGDASAQAEARSRVQALTERFPAFPEPQS